MAKFLDPLVVEEISDSIFQTTQIFRYQSDVAARMFTVPPLFFTDFSSVPRWMPLMYSLLGDTAHEPAVVHDWIFYSATVTFDMANKVLFEAMGVLGMAWYRRYLIYWGVCIGAKFAWDAHRKAGHPETGKFADSPDIMTKPKNIS